MLLPFYLQERHSLHARPAFTIYDLCVRDLMYAAIVQASVIVCLLLNDHDLLHPASETNRLPVNPRKAKTLLHDALQVTKSRLEKLSRSYGLWTAHRLLLPRCWGSWQGQVPRATPSKPLP